MSLADKVCHNKCCTRHFIYWLVGVNAAACLLLMGSMFIPRWRVDPIGTTTIESFWVFTGFRRREYGLLQVRGSYSQSWTTLTAMVCQFQAIGMVYYAGNAVASAGKSFVDWISNGGKSEDVANVTAGCSGSSDCARGFTEHLWTRCIEYQRVQRVSVCTLCFTFLGIILCVAGTLVATLTNRKRSGGVSFGLYLGGFVTLLALNLIYAFVSDTSFKTLAEDAWFPYPSLAIGYFLHLYGTLLVGVTAGTFGYVVLPETFNYDPEQEKIDKRNKRLQKIAKRAGKGRRPQPSMNFPAPPGYPQQGQYPPQFMAPAAGQADFGIGAPASGGLQMQGPACGNLQGAPPQVYGHAAEDFGLGASEFQAGYGVGGVAPGSYSPQYAQPSSAPPSHAGSHSPQYAQPSSGQHAQPPSGQRPQPAGGQFAPQRHEQQRGSVGMPSL